MYRRIFYKNNTQGVKREPITHVCVYEVDNSLTKCEEINFDNCNETLIVCNTTDVFDVIIENIP